MAYIALDTEPLKGRQLTSQQSSSSLTIPIDGQSRLAQLEGDLCHFCSAPLKLIDLSLVLTHASPSNGLCFWLWRDQLSWRWSRLIDCFRDLTVPSSLENLVFSQAPVREITVHRPIHPPPPPSSFCFKMLVLQGWLCIFRLCYYIHDSWIYCIVLSCWCVFVTNINAE